MTDNDWTALRNRLAALACARFGPDLAEDIVQDTLLRFFSRPRPDVRDLARYLRTAVMHEGASAWRSLIRHRESQLPAAYYLHGPGGEDVVGDAVATADELARIVEILGSDTIDLLVDYYYQGSPAVATGLGVNPNTLRVLICGTRAALRPPKRFASKPAGASRLRRLRELAEARAG